MLFSEVIGQAEVKQKLIASVQAGRIPHAQIFYGAEGSGSLALAIAYAQYIACLNRNLGDACGMCSSCNKFSKLAHPDLHFVFPVNTVKNGTKDPVSDDFISEWRGFVLTNPYFSSTHWYQHIALENKQGLINRKESETIIKKLNLKPFESDNKFMLIWLPEKMNTTSSNMLLKMIEEPSARTYIFLISENPEQLPETIISRTQSVKLPRISDEEMNKILSEKFSLTPDEQKAIIKIANGNYIKVLEMIESSEQNDFNFEQFVEIMRLCYKKEYLMINEWVDLMHETGRERLKSFFDYSLKLVRENLMMHVSSDELLYLTNKEKDFSERFFPFINGSNILQIYEEMNKAYYDIERNGYAKLVLFDLCFRLIKLIRKSDDQVEDK